METLFFRVAVVSAAVSTVLLALLFWPWWRRRYAPHTRRAVWLVIAAVLLAAPLLPKSNAPVQIQVPARTVTLPAAVPAAPQQAIISAGSVLPAAPVQTTDAAQPAPAETRMTRTVGWGVLLTALWLTGCTAVLLWQGSAYLRARRWVMRCAITLTGYEEWAAELCPRRPVRFFRVNGLGTPMTLGVFRPAVLLPQGEVRRAAVRHELIHVRRWDVGWKVLLLLACAVHWFNPLVWIMSRRADRDIEASCDSLVVADGDAAERRAYGELLLQTAAEQRIPLTTQFGGGKKLMKARLYDLFHPGKKSRVLVGVVLLVCLLAGSLVACREAENGSGEESDLFVRNEQVADGVYCAPIPDIMVERIDNEHWSFTLSEYDPETGAQGQVLGTYTLPLAEKLTLQRMEEDAPRDAGEVGSDGRNRYVSTYLMWPLLRAQAYPGRADLLEIRVQDGAVTSLRWFQVPITDAGEGQTPLAFDPQDPVTWPLDDPDFDVFDPTTWPDDGGGALEEVPKWYWWGPYCENKKYGFALRLPASWRDNYWSDGEEDLTSFFCDALPEEEGALQKLIVQNKPMAEEKLTDRHRLLGQTEGCYVYLYSPEVEVDTLLSWSEEARALYQTMYFDMQALPEEALTWWDGYAVRIHPVTGEKTRGIANE